MLKKYVRYGFDSRKIDITRNVYLDKKYVQQFESNKDIQNCVGRYKKVWNLKEGKCYICSKDFIFKRNSEDKMVKKLHIYIINVKIPYYNI